MSVRSKNERSWNDLNSKRKINERMMKSQANMNELNEKNLYRWKGKLWIGYIEEGESSKQGAQKNQRPTCNYCGKIGHKSNKCWSNRKEKFNAKCYSYNKHGNREIKCKEKPNFEGKYQIARQQDTNLLRYWIHQNILWKQYLGGTTTHGVDATTMVNLGTLEKIV